jgi:cellulose synthase/poly-beta-1,6-N-acetylglucosamine synthase-like glycosyltransferase
VAKKIKIPRDMIAIDLYLQNVVINLGYEVVYNPSAVVLFRPANTLEDFASQVLRASNGHKQITSIYGKTGHHLNYKVALSEGLRNVVKDPIGAASVFLCCLTIPYYKWRIRDLNSSLWHTALSTKHT